MKDTNTVSSGNVINSSGSVGTCTDQFGAHGVEIYIQYLINMASESLEYLSRPSVPDFASSVDATSCHKFP